MNSSLSPTPAPPDSSRLTSPFILSLSLNNGTSNETIPCGCFSTSTHSPTLSASTSSPESVLYFYVGLGLALFSTVAIGTSFIFKKRGLQRLASRDGATRANQGGLAYLRDWVWWCGMLLMAVGEAANLVAYAFAPASLVTPLGALSVIISAVLSAHFLGERLNVFCQTGCALTLVGSTLLVLHAPQQHQLSRVDQVAASLIDPGFLLYLILVGAGAVALIFYASPRWGQRNPFIYVSITGSIGSITVLCCKTIGVLVLQLLHGEWSLVAHCWLSYAIAPLVAVCIAVQMDYLNRALDSFNTALVTPLLYVFFTTFVLAASAILFKEWKGLPADDLLSILIAFMVIVAGIFNLSCFKDIRFSWNDWAAFVFKRRALPPLVPVDQPQPPPQPAAAADGAPNQSSELSNHKTDPDSLYVQNGENGIALEGCSSEEQQAPRERANSSSSSSSFSAVHFRPTATPKQSVVLNPQLQLQQPDSGQSDDAYRAIANGTHVHNSSNSEPIPVPRIPPRDSTPQSTLLSPQNSLVLEGSDTRIAFDGPHPVVAPVLDMGEADSRERQAGASLFERVGRAASFLRFTHLSSVAHERLIEEDEADVEREHLVLSSSLRVPQATSATETAIATATATGGGDPAPSLQLTPVPPATVPSPLPMLATHSSSSSSPSSQSATVNSHGDQTHSGVHNSLQRDGRTEGCRFQ